MATDVQTSPCRGPEVGKVRRFGTSPLVIHLTDWRADRKNAEDFYSSEPAGAGLPKDLMGE